MSELQAALGCTQIDKLPENLVYRSHNFDALSKALLESSKISHILDSKNVDTVNSHYCLFAILDKAIRERRNEIVLQLTERGIGCSVYYPQPVPRMKYYAEKYGLHPDEYLNAGIISDGSIALPVGPHLTEEDMLSIASVLKNILGEI